MKTRVVKTLDRQLPKLPKKIKFCRRCVVSNQRPRIGFDKEGLCGACRFTDIKNSVDWKERDEVLREVCDRFRRNDGRFDVVVPCSGGKDSARVSYELKYNYGMHPLTATWAPFEYTDIGYQNFRNFLKVGGFGNIMGWANAKFQRKLARVAFEAVGDAWQAFSYGQMVYAIHIAKNFDIPLVFFGENGEAEYSGNPDVFKFSGMPWDIWAEQYFKGANVDELIKYGLEETDFFTEKDFDETDLTFYRLPPKEELEQSEIEFHWFSFYKKWIPQENYYCATKNTGFQANLYGRSEGTYSKYASLDDRMDGFHYYQAFIKFGIGRATSDAAHEVRDSHITREEGAALVKRYDGEFPKLYFRDFLEYLDITEGQFWDVIDRYRQPHVWHFDKDEWKLDKAVYDEYDFMDWEPAYTKSLPKSYALSSPRARLVQKH